MQPLACNYTWNCQIKNKINTDYNTMYSNTSVAQPTFRGMLHVLLKISMVLKSPLLGKHFSIWRIINILGPQIWGQSVKKTKTKGDCIFE